MKSKIKKLFNFLVFVLLIECVFSKCVKGQEKYLTKSVEFDHERNELVINVNPNQKTNFNDELDFIGLKHLRHILQDPYFRKIFDNYLQVKSINLKNLQLSHHESKDQNDLKNHSIKKRTVRPGGNVFLDQILQSERFLSFLKDQNDQINKKKNNTKVIKKRSLPRILNYFMNYLTNFLPNEDATTEKSMSDKLTEIFLDDEKVSKKEDKNNVIVPIEDTKLASDIRKEIQTENFDSQILQYGKNIPKQENKLTFIKKGAGTSTPAEIDDFLKQVQEHKVEMYNSIEAKREGFVEDDEDSETDA